VVPAVDSKSLNIARATVLVLFVALVTRLAWLSDDFLITLRTALSPMGEQVTVSLTQPSWLVLSPIFSNLIGVNLPSYSCLLLRR